MRNIIKRTLALIVLAVLVNCSILFAAEYEIDNGHVIAYLNDSKVTGWFKDHGKYYYAEKGELALGFRKIDGKTYFFYTSGTNFGQVATGYVNIEYFEYYFNKDGELIIEGTTPDGKETDEDGAVLDEAGNAIVKDAGYSEKASQDQMSIFVSRMNQWHMNDKNRYAETTTQVLQTVGDISGIVGEADSGVLWNGVPKYEQATAETTNNGGDVAVLTPDNVNIGGVNIVGRR